MPTYIEYDRVQMRATRFLSAGSRPTDAAHLAYIELPETVDEVDLSLPVSEILAVVAEGVRRAPPATVAPMPVEAPEPEPPSAKWEFLDA